MVVVAGWGVDVAAVWWWSYGVVMVVLVFHVHIHTLYGGDQ